MLLDTCATIWISKGDPLAREVLDELERARSENISTYVSPITAWEMGLLVSRGRLNLLMPPERWFTRLMEAPGVQLAEM